MYSKLQASKLRQEFWTRFGQYMRPVKGENGDPINWINYRTGVKGVYFRMEVGTRAATIAIELKDTDDEKRLENYNTLLQVKDLLEQETAESWTWEERFPDERGQMICRIGKTLEGINLFNEADWPAIISFLKPRIIALDRFWNFVKEGFE